MSGFEFNKDMALKLVFQRADDPEPIGVLDFSGPEMTFSGRADESAKAFFDAVIKNQVGWNERQLDVRREVERKLAAANAALAEARRMISEINDENERLSAELAAEGATTASLLRTIALIREAGGLAREDLDALPDAVKATRQQRDEARIRVCELCARMGGVYRRINREVVECKTPEEIAEVCGWKCFAQQEGGGA